MSELYSMKNRKKFSNTDTQTIFIQAGITSQVSLSKKSEKNILDTKNSYRYNIDPGFFKKTTYVPIWHGCPQFLIYSLASFVQCASKK